MSWNGAWEVVRVEWGISMPCIQDTVRQVWITGLDYRARYRNKHVPGVRVET